MKKAIINYTCEKYPIGYTITAASEKELNNFLKQHDPEHWIILNLEE